MAMLIEVGSCFCNGICKVDSANFHPVEVGFVKQEWEYLYSSARDYNGTKGLVKITKA